MKKYVILIISIFLICGCEIKPQIEKEEQVIDGLNFKVEYENYNSLNYQLNIEKDNIIVYKNLQEEGIIMKRIFIESLPSKLYHGNRKYSKSMQSYR